MTNSNNTEQPMVQARIWIDDPTYTPDFPKEQWSQNPLKKGAILKFTLALSAETFPRACMEMVNVGVFVEHNGENVWFPPRSIVKVIEVKKALVV